MIRDCLERKEDCILACSALKESYGEYLLLSDEVRLVYLRGSYDLIQQRLSDRSDHYMNPNEKPHLIVGIEAEGDFENVIREAGTIAGDTAPKGEPVDLIRVIRGESGVGQYLIEEVKPFYERE